MNQQSEEILPEQDMETAVVEYLTRNGDFFERNPSLLNLLHLPHQSGGAVSLVERQVNSLRKQADDYKRQMEQFITVARENELLNERLHRLTLDLIDCIDFNEVVNTLQDKLRDDFRAEAVELHLYSQAEADLDSNPDLDGFREVVDSASPRCGALSGKKLEYLFGPQAEDIQSTALIPIRGEGLIGILAIGSHNKQRFHPGMGTDYLKRLGEIVSKTLEVVSEPGF
jgi:uncharacterized protein YigA (DUF484 family)